MNSHQKLTSHEPDGLPIESNKYRTNPRILELIEEANLKLHQYQALLKQLTNPMETLVTLVNQEAVLSSRIEGMNCKLEDIVNYEAGYQIDVEADMLREVINIKKALFYATDVMGTIYDHTSKGLPLSGRLIKEMHRLLLSNQRGQSLRKGVYKVHQNYIGTHNKIELVPVSPQDTDCYMGNLEHYIHLEDEHPIVQSAFIHAQFEMIHPFEDGNGRLGRLLIPLFLYYREALTVPLFFMSRYFEKNRAVYIDKLNTVFRFSDWEGWLDYYLTGVIEQVDYHIEIAILHLDAS
ncbi:Fic family protein [Staphylococcus simulans]